MGTKGHRRTRTTWKTPNGAWKAQPPQHEVDGDELWQIPKNIVTAKQVEAAKSPRGGWTKATLAEWGIPWPPPRGWRRRITR
jgi:hypothetical protein